VLEGVDLRRILLEITEHAIVDDYESLKSALQPLRDKGLRLAIDDAGAGYASMRHIVNLHPDMIKLDISLTRNIDTDHSRRSLAKALITFARDIGSIISAEGVENSGRAGDAAQPGRGQGTGVLPEQAGSVRRGAASAAGGCASGGYGVKLRPSGPRPSHGSDNLPFRRPKLRRRSSRLRADRLSRDGIEVKSFPRGVARLGREMAIGKLRSGRGPFDSPSVRCAHFRVRSG